MTLKELKESVLQMIEEISDTPGTYTDDPDLDKKLDAVINQVMFELARHKKIPARRTLEIRETEIDEDGNEVEVPLEYNLDNLGDFYQLERVIFKDLDEKEQNCTIFGTFLEFETEGNAKVYYWKYPTKIVQEDDVVEYDEDGEEISRVTYDETYKFELSQDALEILPYGVASDLLKSDVSAKYGQVYAQRYNEMLERLDSRYNLPTIYFEEQTDNISEVL